MGIEQGIRRAARSDNAFLALAVALTCAAAAAFYVPALNACAGDFPVPLDDVFIHFDFARSLCRGHPFEWIAGQGFSSGETSPLYALVLAVGYAAGFRARLAWVSALVSVASLVWAMTSLRTLLRQTPVIVAATGAAMLVAIGALDFTLFSGMEVALLVALLFRAFVLADRMMHAAPDVRARAQWRLGLWGVLLVWTRPESAVVIAVFSVLAARHARSQSPLVALVRVATPGALATLAVAFLDRVFTGDWVAAGARLKLLSSNPYLSDTDRAREVVLNAFYFAWKVVDGSMVAHPRFLVVLGVGIVAPLFSPRTRELGAAVLGSALLWAALVSFNGAARYQGFRYYAPAVAMIVCAMALGLGALARRFGVLAAGTFGLLLACGAASRAGGQVRFYRDASANVHDQQARVGKMLEGHAFPPGRVLVNDAGAIPWFADRGAVDALGLGGFRGLPFTRAALNGEGSTVELIQRLDPVDRPTLLALYPNWFPGVTRHFAHELARVTIEHNVICGGPTKIIALADWRVLDGDSAPPATLDDIDIADLESEDAHAYEPPTPHGGYVVLDVRSGAFDAGRIVPEGMDETFRVRASASRAALVLRSDTDIDARVTVGATELDLVARGSSGWAHAETSGFAISSGERVVVRARRPLRDFHIWIVSR
jgi:hypothetical protein